MSSNIKIIFFNLHNIDGISNQNNKSIENEKIDLAKKIIDNFISCHVVVDFQKEDSKSNEIKYSFIYQIQPGKTVECKFYIMNNLSCLNNNLLNVNSFIVFINLENEDTNKKLENFIKALNDSSSEVNLYIVGIFKDKILHKLEKKSIKKIINKYNENTYYYIIYTGEKKSSEKENNYDFDNSNKALEQIFSNIYTDLFKTKSTNEEEKDIDIDENKDKSKCLIY